VPERDGEHGNGPLGPAKSFKRKTRLHALLLPCKPAAYHQTKVSRRPGLLHLVARQLCQAAVAALHAAPRHYCHQHHARDRPSPICNL
jgi:hypothetical protein